MNSRKAMIDPTLIILFVLILIGLVTAFFTFNISGLVQMSEERKMKYFSQELSSLIDMTSGFDEHTEVRVQPPTENCQIVAFGNFLESTLDKDKNSYAYRDFNTLDSDNSVDESIDCENDLLKIVDGRLVSGE